MSYQHWGFYLCLIWSHKHSLDASNQNRISMALKIGKHSFRKYIQFFISVPTEKRLPLMLSDWNLKFKRKLQTVKGKGVALLGFRVMNLHYKKNTLKNYLSISMGQFVHAFKRNFQAFDSVTWCRRWSKARVSKAMGSLFRQYLVE